MGLFHTSHRILRSLLNFMSFLLGNSLSLLRSLWMAVQPSGVSATFPSFALFASLVRVLSTLSPRSSMLSSIDPSTEPVTLLHIDFVPLIRTLWASHLATFQYTSLSVYLIYTSSVCLWGYHQRKCQQYFLKSKQKPSTALSAHMEPVFLII